MAVINNGTAVQLYINGIADGSGTNTNWMTVDMMHIARFSEWEYYYSGSIDEVRIWNTARTTAQIRENMMKSLTGNKTGLAGFEVYRRSDVEEYWQLIAGYADNPELTARGGVFSGNDYSFSDETIEPMKNYSYLLVAIEVTGQRMFETRAELTTDVAYNKEVIPTKYELYPAYPNPFNPATTIKFALPELQHVKICVFDINGRQVAELVNATMNTGTHRVAWNAANVSSGTYFIRMETVKFQAREKCLLVK